MTMNGYNFTERVRKVLAQARAEAIALHHEYVGTEHILLGIARDNEGVASAVLGDLGVRSDDIIERVLEIVKPGHPVPKPGRTAGPDLPYTSRAKKVLELAMSEARMLSHSYVGTEHLLLGTIAEEKGIAAQVLRSMGVTLERARSEALRILGAPREVPAPPDSLVGHPVAPGYARSRSPYGVALVDDFTGRARDVLRTAYDEAAGRDHRLVELSHVLLALSTRDDGMAAVLIDQVAGSRKTVAEALRERLPDKEAPGDRHTLQLAPETQQALDNALLEASKDGHRRAGTQHLLLAALDALPLALAAACAQVGLTAKATRTVYERMRE
jgi:ATP-dependent Clp protease ATP-binding subunit ClpC